MSRFLKHISLEVLRFILGESKGLGVNVPVLARYWARLEGVDLSKADRKTYNRYIRRALRLAKYLAKGGYAEITKADGLTWVKLTPAGVDLISIVSKFQTLSAHGNFHRYLHPNKWEARQLLKSRRRLESQDWAKLYQLFEDYLEDVNQKIVILKDPDFDDYLVVKVKHRFRKYRLIDLIHVYRSLWKSASRYQTGVFITLTMNPLVYPDLRTASYFISMAFNRFMSYLRRRFKNIKLAYIAVLEFQDSGNPHLHVVLFGINRIMDHYRLTAYLVRWGFGPIHYEYKIVNRGGRWVWADSNPQSRPKTASSSVSDYLEKYLKKTFDSILNDVEISSYTNPSNVDVSNMKVAMYWALDKRFFTYSRTLSEPEPPTSPLGYVLVWSGYWYECPDPLYYEIRDVIHAVLGPP